MRTIAIGAIAALFLATGTAHAGMCSNYLCGEVEVHHCLAKPGYNDGKFWSYQTTINIPLKDGEQEQRVRNVTSGLFVHDTETDKAAYYLKGKRYSCKKWEAQ